MTYEEAEKELLDMGFAKSYTSPYGSYVTFTYTYEDGYYVDLDLALDPTYSTYIRLYDENDEQISDDIDFHDHEDLSCTLEDSYEKAIKYLLEN